jgi:hypothetical protein
MDGERFRKGFSFYNFVVPGTQAKKASRNRWELLNALLFGYFFIDDIGIFDIFK